MTEVILVYTVPVYVHVNLDDPIASWPAAVGGEISKVIVNDEEPTLHLDRSFEMNDDVDPRVVMTARRFANDPATEWPAWRFGS